MQPPAAQRIVTAARQHFLPRLSRRDDGRSGRRARHEQKDALRRVSGKTALLRAVLLDKFRSVETDLDAIMARCSADALAALQQLLACMQRHTEEIQPPFVRDIRREAPELFKLVEERRRGMIQRYFGKIFDEGRAAGIIRTDVSTRADGRDSCSSAVQAIMNPTKMDELGLQPKTGLQRALSDASGRRDDQEGQGERISLRRALIGAFRR